MTAYISKNLYSWLIIDPFEYHETTQTSIKIHSNILIEPLHDNVFERERSECRKKKISYAESGRIQNFYLGAQKVMCQHAHYERGTVLTFGRGGPA